MLIRAADSQPINPSECASQVEAGMVLEMSIILRDYAAFAFEDNKPKCPRCGHVNLGVPTRNGWIEW